MSLPPILMQDETRGNKPEIPRRAESTRLSGNGNDIELSGSEALNLHFFPTFKFYKSLLFYFSKGGSTRTLTNNRKRPSAKQYFNSLQRHSSGHLDYDNVEDCGNMAASMQDQQQTFSVGAQGVRARSRTMGDGIGKLFLKLYLNYHNL